jgi:rhodanese-related sulfurtransferase
MKPRIALLVTLLSIAAYAGGQTADTTAAASQVEPAAMVKLLSAEKPLVLMVGPRFIYSQAHIPGAEYIGMASKPEGLKALQDRVEKVPKTQRIILYCGCCPWNYCPNIAPALNELKSLGFKDVKVLHLADNFGTDWSGKGYAVEKGGAGK